MSKRWTGLLALVGALAIISSAAAQQQYGPGVTDTEIKIGQTTAYSGPASAYGNLLSKTEVTYVRMINERGGINGRKITLISLDDGYSPPKTVEQTRRLVEQDHVLGIFDSLGTAPNAAIQEYLNEQHIPHFAISGASRFNDPSRYPWTMGVIASYETEGRVYAKYILQNIKDAKIAVLYQNDDLGKDYFKGLQAGLGDRAGNMLAKAVSYELTDPTIDSQIIALKASGANVLFVASSPKFAAQAIRKAYELDWRPTRFLSITANSIPAALVPAGVEKSIGIISVSTNKDPGDPMWANDKGMQDYLAFMKSHIPDKDPNDLLVSTGYNLAQIRLHVLERCGDKLTRENVMYQATHMHDVEFPMLLPGIKVNTSPTNYRGFNQLQLEKFDGKRWVAFGEVIGE
ncbi:MAG TPA: ABC transporter substrate-binding protein [Xanthobacteraceae bacterium]|nr:ABC transporter substrate-binding protein [Xanthobacteraceae bacterium]